MPPKFKLGALLLFTLLHAGCKSRQLDHLLGREHRNGAVSPAPPPEEPAPQNPCIAQAIGKLVDTGVPPTLDLTQATVITASLAGTQICSEIANVSATGEFTLLSLATGDQISSVNITVKITDMTLTISRNYDPSLNPSILDDINLP